MTIDERLADLERRIKALEAAAIPDPEANMPEDCRRHVCSYFEHYLAYGGPDLTHEGFHAAEKQCAEVQKRAEAWFAAHSEGQLPPALESLCRSWEARVRA